VKRVLRFDRPLAGGFLSLTALLALRVVVAAFAAVYMKVPDSEGSKGSEGSEGCGIA
jgi:hypothetical protein